MASHRAIASEGAEVDELKPSVQGGSDVITIEINQLRLGFYAVRIMAGGAGSLLIDDVKTMAAVLPEQICGAKTLIAQDAAAIMAFVAKRVTADAFNGAVGHRELALKNRSINRAVRPVWAGAAGFDSLIVVMAVGAVNPGGGGERGKQTGDVCIFADRFDRMIREVGWVELKAFVCLDNLPIHMRGPAPDTVGMASEAKLVFGNHRIYHRSRSAQPLHSREGARCVWSGCGGGFRSVRVVTINTGGMAGGVDWIFHRVMDTGGGK